MQIDSRIFIAGHRGLLGSALLRKLQQEKYNHLLTASREEVDYFSYSQLEDFFKQHRPEYIFLAAGRTGGILANKTYPAQFLYENLAIQNNFFKLATDFGAKALIFYASSCVYPRISVQPMSEDLLLAGPIEPTSQAYAAAKIAGIFGCQAYNSQFPQTKMICLLPNSMYGPFDNFDTENSHVLSAIIRKVHDAKAKNQSSLSLWGTGTPRREFISSDDVATASIFAIQNKDLMENRHYNIGSGQDYSIRELATIIQEIIGFKGDIHFDASKPDGAPQKLLDSSRFLSLGWKPSVDLENGIERTYEWFKKSVALSDT